jgi:hypothetical protein
MGEKLIQNHRSCDAVHSEFQTRHDILCRGQKHFGLTEEETAVTKIKKWRYRGNYASSMNDKYGRSGKWKTKDDTWRDLRP